MNRERPKLAKTKNFYLQAKTMRRSIFFKNIILIFWNAVTTYRTYPQLYLLKRFAILIFFKAVFINEKCYSQGIILTRDFKIVVVGPDLHSLTSSDVLLQPNETIDKRHPIKHLLERLDRSNTQWMCTECVKQYVLIRSKRGRGLLPFCWTTWTLFQAPLFVFDQVLVGNPPFQSVWNLSR